MERLSTSMTSIIFLEKFHCNIARQKRSISELTKALPKARFENLRVNSYESSPSLEFIWFDCRTATIMCIVTCYGNNGEL